MFPYLQQVRGHIFHHSIPTSKWRFSFCGFCCCFCCCFFFKLSLNITFHIQSHFEFHWSDLHGLANSISFIHPDSSFPKNETRRNENVGGGYSLEFLVDGMAYTQRDQEGAQNSNSVAPLGFSRKFVFCFRQILFIRKYVTFWRNNHKINMKIYALRETKKYLFSNCVLEKEMSL